ncbi:MAG TPA: Fic family protein [Acidimicrobiales bacterium]|nr:Fic family protein [Acidimicrobiales bacterium]
MARRPHARPGTPPGGPAVGVWRPEIDLQLEDTAESSWPAVTYEEHGWVPRHELVRVSRRERSANEGPYGAAVVEPIAGIPDVKVPPRVSTNAGGAAVEIARFDAALGFEIAPFASILLRTESVASSKIEHLTASVTAIALAELGDRGRRDASQIVANIQAMKAASELADRLDADAILEMHDALLGAEHPEWVGRWRDEQVWIGGGDHGPHEAAFVPPHHSRVPAAMDDLVAFVARHDLPPLVHAAVAHAQFETIHPFPDGNGRVGRALVHALLRGKRLTQNVTVPVSAGLLTDTDSYFQALTEYRAGNPAPIVERFADASFAAIANGQHLVNELRAVRKGWDDVIKARSDAAAWRVADLLVRQPIIDSALTQRELHLSRQNTNVAIERLSDAGILREMSGYGRNRRWEAREILVALDAFAKRSGRHG